MRVRLVVIVLFLTASRASQAIESRFLCKSHEQVVFGCTVGTKIAALCASKTYSHDSGYLQYRFGAPNRLELVYPSKLQPPGSDFQLGTTMHFGGGENAVRFTNNGVEYVLFDRTIRTQFKPKVPNNPQFSAGVMTRHHGKRTSLRFCSEFDASIRASAYRALPRDSYHLDIE